MSLNKLVNKLALPLMLAGSLTASSTVLAGPTHGTRSGNLTVHNSNNYSNGYGATCGHPDDMELYVLRKPGKLHGILPEDNAYSTWSCGDKPDGDDPLHVSDLCGSSNSDVCRPEEVVAEVVVPVIPTPVVVEQVVASIEGCMDSNAPNYNSEATVQPDGSCESVVAEVVAPVVERPVAEPRDETASKMFRPFAEYRLLSHGSDYAPSHVATANMGFRLPLKQGADGAFHLSAGLGFFHNGTQLEGSSDSNTVYGEQSSFKEHIENTDLYLIGFEDSQTDTTTVSSYQLGNNALDINLGVMYEPHFRGQPTNGERAVVRVGGGLDLIIGGQRTDGSVTEGSTTYTAQSCLAENIDPGMDPQELMDNGYCVDDINTDTHTETLDLQASSTEPVRQIGLYPHINADVCWERIADKDLFLCGGIEAGGMPYSVLTGDGKGGLKSTIGGYFQFGGQF